MTVAGPVVLAWLADLADEWLKTTIRARVGDGSNLWNVVVATALYGRLLSGTPNEKRRVLSAIDRGRADWQISRPRSWFVNLPSDQIDRVEELALAELDMIEESIVHLKDLDQSQQSRELIKICHRRDDLQAVRVLLQHVRPDGRVAMALNDFDSSMEEFMDDLSPIELPFDERLRRMAQFGATSWWELPAKRMS